MNIWLTQKADTGTTLSNQIDHPLPQRPFEIQGHRGCRGLYPENTIPAFTEALRLGIRTLELDVVVTADKQLLVSHEPWLSPEICTDENGMEISTEEEGMKYNLYQLTLEQIRKFDCGSKPHPRFPLQKKMSVSKPSLVEVIDRCASYAEWNKAGPVFYNIELKSSPEWDGIYHPAPQEFCSLLLQVLREKGILRRTLVQSFDYRILETMNKLEPTLRLSALAEEPVSLKQVVDSIGFVPDVFSPYHAWINSAMISEWHQREAKVIPWTVNDETSMQRVYDLGADGLITDYPDKALEYFKKK
jgi:glycerophosphoryl diester phosphodiesterase